MIAFPFYPICVANTVTEDVKNKYCENEGVFYCAIYVIYWLNVNSWSKISAPLALISCFLDQNWFILKDILGLSYSKTLSK